MIQHGRSRACREGPELSQTLLAQGKGSHICARQSQRGTRFASSCGAVQAGRCMLTSSHQEIDAPVQQPWQHQKGAVPVLPERLLRKGRQYQ
jgi:hypothetical protein